MYLSVSRNLQESGSRGLQKFGSLLLNELKSKYKVQVVSKTEKSDIHLIIISGSMKASCKNVVRIDGVYYDIDRLKMNNPIRSSIKKSDGVIFQSKWSETFATRMLKITPRKSTVIHNGTGISGLDIPKYKHNFERAFVCCSNWRVNKRLKSIIRAFLAVWKENRDIGLFVIGKPDFKESHPNIKYLGHLQQHELWSVYKSSDYMCHICHLDACPNSVVEGLVAGLPVLCNNIGGTPEIVGDSGIILPLDDEFDFRPIEKMKKVGSNSIDLDILIQGMKQIMTRSWNVVRPDLDISVAAKKYYAFFESLL